MKTRAFLRDYGVPLVSLLCAFRLGEASRSGGLEISGDLGALLLGGSDRYQAVCYRLPFFALGAALLCCALVPLTGRSPAPVPLKHLGRIAWAVLAVCCALAIVARTGRVPMDRFREEVPPQGEVKDFWEGDDNNFEYPRHLSFACVAGALGRREIVLGEHVAILDCNARGCDFYLTGTLQGKRGSDLMISDSDRPPPLQVGWCDRAFVTTEPVDGHVLVRVSGELWRCELEAGICRFIKLRDEHIAPRVTVPRTWLWGGLLALAVTSFLLWQRRRLGRVLRSREQMYEGVLEPDGRVVLSDGATLSVDSLDRLAPGPVLVMGRGTATPYREAEPLRGEDILPGKRSEILERTEILLTRLDATIVSIAFIAASPLIGGVFAGLIP